MAVKKFHLLTIVYLIQCDHIDVFYGCYNENAKQNIEKISNYSHNILMYNGINNKHFYH